jgi:primase-polymerase (primpol)-like protein
MPDHKILSDLKQCMRNCNGSKACMDACEATFKQGGGTVVEEGGKVFTAPDGSKGYVTKGGKVF